MFRKHTITNIDGSAPYLVRWSINLPFGLSLKLHQILRPDDDRCQHDHPWWFLRLILWGGYVEELADRQQNCLPWRPWAPWRVYFCPLHFRHRIRSLHRESSWSLVLCGRKVRTWGFFTRLGWVKWNDFVNQVRTQRVLWCSDGRELRKD